MHHWDRRFYRMAHEVATWSKDPNKQVGAVLVSPDHRQICVGYNGPPKGYDKAFTCKEHKNEYTIHAEVNAVLNAAVDIKGWTMYVSEPPCLQCALVIAQKDLARLVCKAVDPNSSWAESTMKAKHLLIDRLELLYL